MFKSFHVDTVNDLIAALSKKLGICIDSIEHAKMQAFIMSKTDDNNCIKESLKLIWKKTQINIEPVECYKDGYFGCNGYVVSSEQDQDCVFAPYTVTGFDNLIYSLGSRFKLKPTDETMIEIKGYLNSLIPEKQTDLVSPCGLYIKKYPVYINALASYSDTLEMWTTEYVVTCGDRRADLPMFNIS